MKLNIELHLDNDTKGEYSIWVKDTDKGIYMEINDFARQATKVIENNDSTLVNDKVKEFIDTLHKKSNNRILRQQI